MTASEQIVRTVADAPWLPPGGRADVVRAEGVSCPEPASLVRLLVERDDAVFCAPPGRHREAGPPDHAGRARRVGVGRSPTGGR